MPSTASAADVATGWLRRHSSSTLIAMASTTLTQRGPVTVSSSSDSLTAATSTTAVSA